MRQSRPRGRFGRLATATGLCLVAGALVVVAAPRVVASLTTLPGEAVLGRIQDRRPVTAGELERLIRSRENALAWHATGRLWTDLALARLMLVERRRIIRADRDLPAIRDALRRGLAMAPANPYGWTRLAAVESALGAPPEAQASYVQMAILTGPYERPLVFPRLDLALAVWPAASLEDRSLIAQQIRWAWRADRQATLAAARRAAAVEAIRTALADSRENALALEDLLAEPDETVN